MRKKLLIVLTVLTLVSLTSMVTVFAADKVELVYQNWTVNEIPVEKELIAQFEEENPDIDIVLQTSPVEDMHDKLLLLARAKRTPDIMETIPEWIVEFAEMGVVAPLDKYEDMSSNFVEGAWNMGKWKGTIYGVPWRYGASATFINTRLRTEAGLEVPDEWTWEEFVDYAKKLTDAAEGVYGFAVPGSSVDLGSSWCYSAFLFANGGRLLDDEGKAAINSPEAVEALEFYVDLLKEHKVMPPNVASFSSNDVTNLFANDKVAMWQNGPWYIATMEKQYTNLEFDVAPMPTNEQDGSPAGGTLLSISSITEHPDEAMRFIEFMTSEKIMAEWAKSGQFLPPVKSVLDKPFINYSKMGVFAEQAAKPNTRVIGNLPEFTTLAEYWQVAIEKAFTGVMPPKEALDEAAAKWNEVLSKY